MSTPAGNADFLRCLAVYGWGVGFQVLSRYLRDIVSMAPGHRVASVQGLQADPTEGIQTCPYALGSFRNGCQPSGPVASFSDQGYSGCSIPWRDSMSERRFVLADFTHMSTTECLRIYEAGNMYTMPRAVTHAAAKHELVARERPADWTPPSIIRLPEVLTEADVVEAEAPTPPVAAGDRPAVGTGARQMWRRLPARTREFWVLRVPTQHVLGNGPL
jgi:hypothetical protein